MHACDLSHAEVQRRAANVLLTGSDAVIQSETGSGKTLAFMLPALARLDYPPALFPEDLDGPQALVVVPTMELGVQVRVRVRTCVVCLCLSGSWLVDRCRCSLARNCQ